MRLGGYGFCLHMWVYFVSLSVVWAAYLSSLHRNATGHRARKYRSDHFFSSVCVCTRVPKNAVPYSSLGCDNVEALSSVFAGDLPDQKATNSVFHIADIRARDFRVYVGSVAHHLFQHAVQHVDILRLS